VVDVGLDHRAADAGFAAPRDLEVLREANDVVAQGVQRGGWIRFAQRMSVVSPGTR